MESLSVSEMRAAERAAIDGGRATGLELMERAGRGLVEAVLGEWPDLASGARRAAVLCGPGANGGDGFVVARLLRERGWRVDAFLLGDPGRLPPDARAAHGRWREAGGRTAPVAGFDAAAAAGSDLVVDALFGTGLARPIEGLSGAFSALAGAAAGESPPRIVAADIPSGLSADTGAVLAPSGGGPGAARADLTVTFHRAKHGHVLGDGPAWCGKVVVADIGL